MAIDFPNSPANGALYSAGGKNWYYNGTAWVLQGVVPVIPDSSITATQLASDAVTTAKILDANVTAGKIASGAAVSNIGYTPANIAGPTFTGTVVLPSTTSIGTVSSTEIGYVDGVTSAIQTQLDSKLATTTAQTSNRNVVINGAMQVAQRGTTFTGLTSFQYSLDRWKSFRLSGAPYNISQQATSDTTNLPNIQYCARVGRANSNTNLQLVFFSQSFESLNSRAFAGKIATVSFYARKGANFSAASDALKVELNTGTGTDQDVINGFTGQASPINQTATLTTTWQRFTYTSTTLSSSMTQLAINFYYTPVGTAGAADYFEITGVQVEAGAVATPFESEDFGTTLAKCERYYYEQNYTNLYYNIFNSGNFQCSFAKFPVSMRATPTITVFDGAGNAGKISIANAGGTAQNNITPPVSIDVNTDGWQYVAGGIAGTTGNNGMMSLTKYTASIEL